MRHLRRIWHLRRAAELAARWARPTDRAQVLGLAARLALREIAPNRRHGPVPLKLGDLGTIRVRDFSELLVLWEVLVEEVYAVPELPEDVELILDLGCNVGASMLWFHHRYPDARIVGYEADPVTAELARRNTAGRQGLEVHATAVGGEDGAVTFWRIAGQSWASGTSEAFGVPVSVPARSLDSILGTLGRPVDILKLNVEGAEHAALGSASRLDLVRTILGQYHPVDGATWAGLVRTLDGFEVRPSIARDDEPSPFIATRRTDA